MHRWGPITTIGVLTAAMASGINQPAGAADPAHSVTVSKDESIVLVGGLTEGETVQVVLRRNGIQIGSATGVAPAGGLFELNHKIELVDPPVVDPATGGEDEVNNTGTAVCWTDFTPEILGGDELTVTTGTTVDELVVSDIDITQEPTKVDANTGVVRGRVAGPVPPISQLSVSTQGRTASDERFDGLAPGLVDGVAGTLKYTSGGRFKATFDGLSRIQMGAFLDSEDVRVIHETASGLAGSHTTEAVYGADARFTEDLCPPVARRAVTGASLGAINRSNVDRPLKIWGVSADATSVRVGVEDRNGRRRTWPATVTGTGIAQTWSVTYPAGSLRRFADGRLTISATHIGDAGALAGGPRRIHKDTVAPALPKIRPGGSRRFVGRELVRLRSWGAQEIWYTLNGSRPARNRGAEYTGQFRLARTAVLRAIAFDRAGNASRVSGARFLRVRAR
ncbi:chitobiase/beta-hexosaminidase C-terminal domain-containing protein [Nocardioides sp.]|uniref:chitobiase/beta-hexosaminidase C-terminal domain-containing protein n=1 Tax=Nocardioides sp. TaxID=35761 RepID=UPI002D805145|nr:chitobiase/beta-hexosaminidase C-terminal domain-containing protein [Nocardioides sp.]HET8961151.1 chitobiase/beta-hexosaminidase C-terminal domain-containing protein [Nocardioides sp.]